MSIFYVDLSSGVNGNGSIDTPFNITGLVAATPANGDVFNIKGSVGNITSAMLIGSSITNAVVTYQAWDAEAYGPWVIKSTGNVVFGKSTGCGSNSFAEISGGIIDVSMFELWCRTALPIKTCKISAVGILACRGNAGFKNISGCTLSAGTSISVEIATDCAIYSSGYAAIAGTYNNCAITNSQASFDINLNCTFNNCQFEWSAPSLPAWNASRSSYLAATLSAGITTPPQPGTSPYTGYATGLWGTERIGIGAMDFPAPAPVPEIPEEIVPIYTSHRLILNGNIIDTTL